MQSNLFWPFWPDCMPKLTIFVPTLAELFFVSYPPFYAIFAAIGLLKLIKLGIVIGYHKKQRSKGSLGACLVIVRI